MLLKDSINYIIIVIVIIIIVVIIIVVVVIIIMVTFNFVYRLNVKTCCLSQDMVQQFLVMLTTHQDVNLRFLSFRLDFNEHYKKKDPKIRSPLTHRFSKRYKKGYSSSSSSSTPLQQGESNQTK